MLGGDALPGASSFSVFERRGVDHALGVTSSVTARTFSGLDGAGGSSLGFNDTGIGGAGPRAPAT